MQKKFSKLLQAVICKNQMKLGVCKKLVEEAMSILQQPGMERFKNFFLLCALGIIGGNLNSFFSCFNNFYKMVISKINLADAFRRSAEFHPRCVRELCRGCQSRHPKIFLGTH